MTQDESAAKGKVYLVGAGPGDPGLITLRGIECLQRADVVLFDYLANAAILEHARAEAERICVGKHGRGRVWTQDEINERMVALALQGRTVVRLKGGDPTVFARAADEIEALVTGQIPFEIVPGVTAASAAGCYAGIPVTHRAHASAVALITGQEEIAKQRSSLDYQALAAFPGTLVFYMGVTTAAEWTAGLIAAGKPDITPAAIIRRCSLPDQRVIRCSLGQVAQAMLSPERIRPPAIVVVGEVAAASESFSWFDKRPLFTQRIMVTRPREQAEQLARLLAELGAEVILQPAIQINPPQDWQPVDAALARLRDFDWLVFSSRNGVRLLLDRLLATGQDLRALADVQLAAVGPGTREELARYHLRVDLQPPEFRAESLAAALQPQAAGKRFLLARASRGREVLADELRAAGADITQVVVYASTDVDTADASVADELARGRIDWVTVTSSAIARSLHRMFGDSLAQAKLASISPVTSDTLRECGQQPAVEATEYTMQGVANAILQAVSDEAV